MFLLLALLLLTFFPSPWDLVGALVSLVLFAGEVLYWQRRMQSREVQTGVENLRGSIGTVAKPLAPVGQIRVHGELWEARSTRTVPSGSSVRVVSVDGLVLGVEPHSENGSNQSDRQQ
jgi:membrane-bound serine protease (ClpP class)